MIRLLAVLALFFVPAAARAEWYEASTRHFVVYSDENPKKLRAFAERLERFDQAVRILRGISNVPLGDANRLTVYVVGNVTVIEKLVGRRDVAGFYRGRAGGSVAFVPRQSGGKSILDLTPEAILLHEYSHHLMLGVGPEAAYPGWFVEGWAEFHATARFDRDGSVIFGDAPGYRAYSLLDGNWLPVEKMMRADTLKLDGEQTEGLYGRGWLLTHYLTFSAERKGQLTAYLAAINGGESSYDAAVATFGDLGALDKELERYKHRGLQAARVAGDSIQVGAVTLRKLSAGAAAVMEVRIRSKNGVDDDTAPEVYEMAKKACAPFPDDAAVQLVLAEAAYDAGDYAAAETAADRALAIDSKAVDGYVYKAMARMAVAARDKDRSDSTWTGIRRIIAAGNQLDPDDPEPLILFFQSYTMAGLAPNDNAKSGLLYAFGLAPQDERLRMMVVQVALSDGNAGAARRLLKPLAYSPHHSALTRLARRMLDAIDRGGAGAALEEMSNGSDAADASDEE